MCDQGLRRELAENGRRDALARDWDLIFDELLMVYITVIRKWQNCSGFGHGVCVSSMRSIEPQTPKASACALAQLS
jgi:hypothetical protein